MTPTAPIPIVDQTDPIPSLVMFYGIRPLFVEVCGDLLSLDTPPLW